MFRELKPSTLLNPVPAVMVSCRGTDINSQPNIITVAWAGTVCSEPPMVSISVRKSRHSHALITQSGEFAINLVNEQLAKACDYCGVKSGRDVDKYNICKLDTIAIDKLQYAPGIAQSPLILGCKVKSVTELGSHDMIIGEIVTVMADSYLFDKDDRLCLDKANLIAYNHGEYFSLGKKQGFFGWSIASKKVLARRGLSDSKPENKPSNRKSNYTKPNGKSFKKGKSKAK